MTRLCGLAVVLLALATLGCGDEKGKTERPDHGANFSDLAVGSGPKVKMGDPVKVFYTGWLQEKPDSEPFDSNVGKDPFEFTVGGPEAIPGMSSGVVGMQVGGKRKLWVPAREAYGRAGKPGEVPPNADLI